MDQVEDTEIKDGHDMPGTLLQGGAFRVETDSLGEVLVPADRLWGARRRMGVLCRHR